MKNLNKLIRKHTAFTGIKELSASAKKDGYHPSLACKSNLLYDGRLKIQKTLARKERQAITDSFDNLMARLGLPNRAYRW